MFIDDEIKKYRGFHYMSNSIKRRSEVDYEVYDEFLSTEVLEHDEQKIK
jgi:hypothetical protein